MIRLRTWLAKVDSERGQASMVTVAMFMMLFAVVAVSFTYIVVTASRQAANDSLQSSAKSAAESGVEDAKRLLVYCYNHRTGDNTYNLPANDAALCQNIVGKRLEDVNCSAVLASLNNSSAKTGFTLEDDGSKTGNYRAKVGSNSNNSEYYQCLKIATKTITYEDVINGGGSSAIIHLKLVDANGVTQNPTQVVIKWHRNAVGQDGDQLVRGLTEGTGFPNSGTWNASNTNRPAVLRVEQVGAKKKGVSIADLISNDSAVTLRPSTKGSNGISITNYHPRYNDYDGNNDQPNSQYANGLPIIQTKCTSDTNQTYACTMNLNGELDIHNSDFYLRLNAIYKNTHFSVSANRNGTPLYFDGIQPVVDVTGKSADSFSRVQAHLEPSYSGSENRWWPEYAIDTDGKVCKDMNVYYDNGQDVCK